MLEFNRNETDNFLKTIMGDTNAVCVFQTFDDLQSRKDKTLVTQFYGTIDQHYDSLIRLNRRGAGIFVTINQTNGPVRKAENINKVRAVFCDIDDDRKELVFPITPTAIVSSGRGTHAYWVSEASDPIPCEGFKSLQDRIIEKMSSDQSVKDLPRVMRLPGFYHQKDLKKPLMVKMLSVTNNLYSHKALLKAFPAKELVSKENRIKKCTSRASFKSWCETLSKDEGKRNPNVYKMVVEGLRLKVEDQILDEAIRAYCDNSGLPLEEALEILNRLRANPPSQKIADSNGMNNHTPETMANLFLRSCTNSDGLRTHHLLRDEYFVYQRSHYTMLPKKELKHDFIRFLQREGFGKFANQKLFTPTMSHLEALMSLPPALKMNTHLSEKGNDVCYIPLQNKMIRFDKRAATTEIVPASPRYFSTACLPHDYNPDAKCPVWVKFIEQMIPDHDIRDLVQEWFGYNLISDSTQGKALIFFGEGANGKTVCTLVLRLLLGEENVCSIPIESFDPKRTFALANMNGKLANIIGDMDEIDRVAEGIFKCIITGDQIQVERKNRDPFQMRPTARQTIATNILPRFRDTSNAVPRRLLLVRMGVTLADESKQDKRLVDEQFWKRSGELPGILNWALAGLLRLYSRPGKSFAITKIMDNDLSTYIRESNPARDFLLDELEVAVAASSISSPRLYDKYKQFCLESGYRHVGWVKFAKEVERAFPSAQRSEHKRLDRDAGRRGHEWIGLKWKAQTQGIAPTVGNKAQDF